MNAKAEKEKVFSMIRKYSGISMVSISCRTGIHYKKVIKHRMALVAEGRIRSTRLGITNQGRQYVNIIV